MRVARRKLSPQKGDCTGFSCITKIVTTWISSIILESTLKICAGSTRWQGYGCRRTTTTLYPHDIHPRPLKQLIGYRIALSPLLFCQFPRVDCHLSESSCSLPLGQRPGIEDKDVFDDLDVSLISDGSSTCDQVTCRE